MTVSPLSHEAIERLPLETLAVNPNISDADKVAEASRQFEAVLLRQILAEANHPDPDENPAVAGVYNDMVNNQLADAISRSGEFGLAQGLQKQLTRQLLPHHDTSAPTPSAPKSH